MRLDQAWLPRVRRGELSDRDVVVVSSGLHWAGRLVGLAPSVLLTAYRCMVRHVLAELRRVDFRGTLLYRTNYAPGCGPAIDANRSTLLPADAPHNWGFLHRFDAIWAEEEKAARQAVGSSPRGSSGSPGSSFWFRILNVSGLSTQRIDAHPCGPLRASNGVEDQVHFALVPGGPVDAWNLLLQSAL